MHDGPTRPLGFVEAGGQIPYRTVFGCTHEELLMSVVIHPQLDCTHAFFFVLHSRCLCISKFEEKSGTLLAEKFFCVLKAREPKGSVRLLERSEARQGTMLQVELRGDRDVCVRQLDIIKLVLS